MYAYKVVLVNFISSFTLFILVSTLFYFMQTLFITTPDMFVFPVCWSTYKDLLRRVLVEDSSKTDPISKNLKRQRERYYEMVRSRNEIFDDKKINPLGMRNVRDALRSRMINVCGFFIFYFIFSILSLFELLNIFYISARL